MGIIVKKILLINNRQKNTKMFKYFALSAAATAVLGQEWAAPSNVDTVAQGPGPAPAMDPMMMMMLLGDNDGMKDLLPLMMMSGQNGGAIDPMMLMMLSDDSADMDKLLPLMMMGGQGGAMDPMTMMMLMDGDDNKS